MIINGINYEAPLEEIPVGKVESHFLDSGSFTLWTKAAEYAKKNGCGKWDYYDTDEFWQYCVVPETKILTSDLMWVEAGTIKPGDNLLGFDELKPDYPKVGRNWQRSIVLSSKRIMRPCYELIFDDGTKVICSSDHKWLSASTASGSDWIKTENMNAGGERASSVVKPIDVWEKLTTWEAGYLAAAYDGEGHLCKSNLKGKNNLQLGYSQKQNAMWTEVEKCMGICGFIPTYSQMDQNVCRMYVGGGCREVLRFLGSVRPRRLLSKFSPEQLGRMTKGKNKRVRLVEKKFLGEREVCAIKTSTKTFLANGLASHNCDAYAEFVKKYAVAIDLYANIDVIPNPKLSWRNQEYLETKHGLKPVPVVHYTTDLKWLRFYVENGYDVIGLGGLVGSTSQEECRAWIDRCFDYVCDTPKRLPRVKLHGFGVTTYELLLRYPWWSVDSTSWTKVAAYGGIMVPHKRKGKWDFSVAPFVMKVSNDSPDLKKRGKHALNLSKAERVILNEWLDEVGVPFGAVADGDKEEVKGVSVHHTYRRIVNLRFFEMMRASLPEYPWPFVSKRRKTLWEVSK